ncbi:hypothetical protein SOPP22_17555 [Shewanella sp. OPT22]|nr:hypothetical protein SOPP22_17555 [Shewanella sp. OPT22]
MARPKTYSEAVIGNNTWEVNKELQLDSEATAQAVQEFQTSGSSTESSPQGLKRQYSTKQSSPKGEHHITKMPLPMDPHTAMVERLKVEDVPQDVQDMRSAVAQQNLEPITKGEREQREQCMRQVRLEKEFELGHIKQEEQDCLEQLTEMVQRIGRKNGDSKTCNSLMEEMSSLYDQVKVKTEKYYDVLHEQAGLGAALAKKNYTFRVESEKKALESAKDRLSTKKSDVDKKLKKLNERYKQTGLARQRKTSSGSPSPSSERKISSSSHQVSNKAEDVIYDEVLSNQNIKKDNAKSSQARSTPKGHEYEDVIIKPAPSSKAEKTMGRQEVPSKQAKLLIPSAIYDDADAIKQEVKSGETAFNDGVTTVAKPIHKQPLPPIITSETQAEQQGVAPDVVNEPHLYSIPRIPIASKETPQPGESDYVSIHDNKPMATTASTVGHGIGPDEFEAGFDQNKLENRGAPLEKPRENMRGYSREVMPAAPESVYMSMGLKGEDAKKLEEEINHIYKAQPRPLPDEGTQEEHLTNISVLHQVQELQAKGELPLTEHAGIPISPLPPEISPAPFQSEDPNLPNYRPPLPLKAGESVQGVHIGKNISGASPKTVLSDGNKGVLVGEDERSLLEHSGFYNKLASETQSSIGGLYDNLESENVDENEIAGTTNRSLDTKAQHKSEDAVLGTSPSPHRSKSSSNLVSPTLELDSRAGERASSYTLPSVRQYPESSTPQDHRVSPGLTEAELYSSSSSTPQPQTGTAEIQMVGDGAKTKTKVSAAAPAPTLASSLTVSRVDNLKTSEFTRAIEARNVEKIKTLMTPQADKGSDTGNENWVYIEDVPKVDLSGAVAKLDDFKEGNEGDLDTATALFEFGGFAKIKTPEEADKVFGALDVGNSPLEKALNKENNVIARHLVSSEAKAREISPLHITIKRGLAKFFSKLFSFVFKQGSSAKPHESSSKKDNMEVDYNVLNEKNSDRKTPLQLLIEQDEKNALLDIINSKGFQASQLSDRENLHDLVSKKEGWTDVERKLRA